MKHIHRITCTHIHTHTHKHYMYTHKIACTHTHTMPVKCARAHTHTHTQIWEGHWKEAIQWDISLITLVFCVTWCRARRKEMLGTTKPVCISQHSVVLVFVRPATVFFDTLISCTQQKKTLTLIMSSSASAICDSSSRRFSRISSNCWTNSWSFSWSSSETQQQMDKQMKQSMNQWTGKRAGGDLWCV